MITDFTLNATNYNAATFNKVAQQLSNEEIDVLLAQTTHNMTDDEIDQLFNAMLC